MKVLGQAGGGVIHNTTTQQSSSITLQLAPDNNWHCSSSLANMALNDQALLEVWSSQRDDEDVVAWHWWI
jgi:hypothetical protein